MKLTIHSSKLRAAADFAVRTAPAKPTMPILGCARLTAGADGTLVVGATDYETWGRSDTTAHVITAGETAVSARLLAEIAAALPEGEVQLVAEGATCSFSVGRAKASAPILPAEDFPTWPNVPTGPLRVLNGHLLAATLGALEPLVNSDGAKPVDTLYRVIADVLPTGLHLAATDRHRLFQFDVPWSEPAPDDDAPSVHLHPLTIRSIVALAKVNDRVLLELPAHDGITMIRVGGVGSQLLTRLADPGAAFPVARVMPDPNAGRVFTAPVADLLDLAERTGRFAQNNAPARITVTEDGLLSMSAGTDADGGLGDDISVDVGDDWEPFSVGVRPGYLASSVKAFGPAVETVSIRVTNPRKPLLITADGDAPWTTTAVVMPVDLNKTGSQS